ncbi:hypothetical protein PMIT1313_00800 [Prochlorococcus marinus str. MIT 1313]|uniref:guanylate-binding protein n=1 Tax=Prochlorococcus TaxID=1218 RepID=UPI0007BB170A|nr:guanylate-binding protein [Prochlorococcus marinus]KZR70150.1 hypothetical protein PMIT1313_00800 [Prochlorococcus marinus str. MIT 1313]KZR72873.1 hypothetical protein PMIT1318_00839 [Prochlorococcus marinus str. MIT 1318]
MTVQITIDFGDHVYVIPDSEYNKLREQENERQVARLEVRKDQPSQVIERLNKQSDELQAALPEAEPAKELASSEQCP